MGRLARATAVAVLLALVGAACGGDDETGSTGATGGGGAGPAPGAEVIRIGVAVPDLEAFATLNPRFSIGDPEEQIEAVLQAWRRDERLPLHGRDIEFVYRSYNIINDDDKLAACTGFAQDDEVFAVIAGRDFSTGSQCLADRFDIPVIDTNPTQDSVYARLPSLFTIRTSETRMLRAFATWADAEGLLEGRSLGVFWDTRSEEAVNALRESLTALGISITSEVSSSGEGVGSPQDQIAVQRFQDDGVDTVLLLVGGSSVTNFMTFAGRQGYAPDYLDLEFAGHIGDVFSSSLDPEQYDGTTAMAISRTGGIAAGFDPNETAEACIADFESFSGQDLEVESPESGELVHVLQTCDITAVLLAGLEGAGEDLTAESFVAALEEIDSMELAAWGDLGFGPDDHSGVDVFRTIAWSADCVCWEALDEEFEPLPE